MAGGRGLGPVRGRDRSLVPSKTAAIVRVEEVKPAPVEEKYDAEPPSEYLCPISYEIMKDPVMDTKGYSYDRVNIEKWFKDKKYLDPVTRRYVCTCPMDNLPIDIKDIRPNRALKNLIDEWKKQHRIAPAAAEAKPAVPAEERKPAPVSHVERKPAPSTVPATPVDPASVLVPEAPSNVLSSLPNTTYVPQLLSTTRPSSTQHMMSSLVAPPRSTPIQRPSPMMPALGVALEDDAADELLEGASLEMLNQAFFGAVLDGNEDDARVYLRNGANVNARQIGSESGDTALIIAVNQGNKNMVQFLCEEAKANVNQANAAGDVALFFAFAQEENWFTDYLLRKGAFSCSLKHEGCDLYSLGKQKYGELWFDMMEIARAEQKPLYRPASQSALFTSSSTSTPVVDNVTQHQPDASQRAWMDSLRPSLPRN